MSNPKNAAASIGIFDSGFGGLTVMRAIQHLLPYENILYFGDTARLPYGNKRADTIIRYSLEAASFLASQGIKALVIACHTACSAALDELRAHFPLPIIGIIEQGVEEILRLSTSGQIAILGTRATISSGVYQTQISTRLPSAELSPIACPLFVPLVEEGYVAHPLAELVAKEYLTPLKERPIDTVLLGCTHYPLLQKIISQELGPNVTLIDPAHSCAEKTRQLLTLEGLLSSQKEKPHYQFYVSDDPEKFRTLGKMFLDYPIEHVFHQPI